MEDATRAWYETLAPHVRKAYASKSRVCSLQLPLLRKICSLFGWQDEGIFEELTRGFRLLGPLAPGLGWRRRSDSRYANPLDMDDFLVKNHRYVIDKLRRCRVDPCWKQLAEEIVVDVGRMEGPFSSPPSWSKRSVPLASHARTCQLLPGPAEHQPTCFAFAVHQVGSDGRPKVRRAEDWRRSFANATVTADDSPPYHDVLSYVQLVKVVKKVDPFARVVMRPRIGLQTTPSARAEPHLGGTPDARRSHPLAAHRPNVWIGGQRMVLLQNSRLNGLVVSSVSVHASFAFCR